MRVLEPTEVKADENSRGPGTPRPFRFTWTGAVEGKVTHVVWNSGGDGNPMGSVTIYKTGICIEPLTN